MRLLIILLFMFIPCPYKNAGFISQAADGNLEEDFQNIAGVKETKDGIRIVISTSGPVEFTSQWLNSPPSLIVEFQSKNVRSKIDNEVIVNQDIIKKVTTNYYEKWQGESLKSLVFELSEKMPYKVHQAGNAILIDIKTSAGPPFTAQFQKEITAPNDEKIGITKRLAAMDKALTRIEENIMPQEDVSPVSEFFKTAPIEKISREIKKTDEKKLVPDIEIPPVMSPKKMSREKALFWLICPVLFLGLGTFAAKHIKYIKHRVRADYDKRFAKLNLQPQEKDEGFKQEETIFNAIEREELQKEKEYGRFQKEKDCQEVEKSMAALKDVLVKKRMLDKSLSSEEEKSWIPEQFVERRKFVRLELSRDYNRTVLLRIESEDKSKSLKCFANNISLSGLRLEAEKEFKEGESLNLRLFFFGDKVPMMRLKAQVKWVKMLPPFYYCGLSFISQKEKEKIELNRYIESRIGAR